MEKVVFKKGNSAGLHFHKLLLDTIKQRDSKKVRQIMDEHMLDNKIILEKQLKYLGNIVGNNDRKNDEEVFNLYSDGLHQLFSRAPRYTSRINVLMKVMGYFSDKLTHNEKEFLIDTIEKYRLGNITFNVPLYVLKAHAVRFNEERLLKQSFFTPYPEELVEIRDSGKLVH